MIKCETSNGELELVVQGKFTEIVTDSAWLIANIYRSILKNDKQKAKEYKRLVMLALIKMYNEIDVED